MQTHTGRHLPSHIREARVQGAKKLMAQRPQWPLARIAANVGFVDDSDLCKAFRLEPGARLESTSACLRGQKGYSWRLRAKTRLADGSALVLGLSAALGRLAETCPFSLA